VTNRPDGEYDNTKVIFEPIKIDKPRDDNRGLSHGGAALRRDFNGVVEEEDDGIVVIQYGAQALPSDEEIEQMKEQLRLEDAEKKEKCGVINRIKSIFGFGG